MTVKELKKLLKKAPDDMQVLIPINGEFDGMFFSPCMGESGVSELGIDDEGDETESTFLLVPHGFFEIDHDAPDPQLN